MGVIPNFVYIYCDKTADEIKEISNIPSALFSYMGFENEKIHMYSYFRRSSDVTSTSLSTDISTNGPFSEVNENIFKTKSVGGYYSTKLTYTIVIGYIPQLEV